MISARDVHKSFGSLEVLKGIDLTCEYRGGRMPARFIRIWQVDFVALPQWT